MLVTLLAVVSCNDHDYDLDKLVPDAYHKISYIKEYGTHNLHLFTTQTEYTDSLILIKAGSDPSASVNLKMDVLDQVAVDSVYNQLLGTNYKVLPANCYSFANGQDVSFTSGQEGQYFPVTFNPTAIYKLAQQDADAQYVLSLQLNTVGKDSVNSDMNRALYVVDVKSPVLGFGTTEIQATMIYKSLDVKIPLVINNTDRNTDDITLALDNAGQAKAVADYNNLHGTSYKLLPSSSYSFSNLGIGKGFIRDTATLVVNRANLENDETYILPLKIGSSSMGEKMQNDSVYSYAIVSVPLYATAVVPVSQCKVVFCNNDNAIGGSSDNAGIGAIFDQNPNSFWHTGWQLSQFTGSDDYYYGYNDHHAFKCWRNADKTIFVVDLQKARNVIGVQELQRSPNNRDAKDAKIYVTADNEFKFTPVKNGGNIADYSTVGLNSWTHLMDVQFAQTAGWQVFNAPSSVMENGGVKGRFMKVHFQSSWRGQNLSVAEFRIVELLAVNGNAVK